MKATAIKVKDTAKAMAADAAAGAAVGLFAGVLIGSFAFAGRLITNALTEK